MHQKYSADGILYLPGNHLRERPMTVHHQRSMVLPQKGPQARPLADNYIGDDIRRQFFRDHPFESFRSRSLTEQASSSHQRSTMDPDEPARTETVSRGVHLPAPSSLNRVLIAIDHTQRRAVHAEPTPGARPHARRHAHHFHRAVPHVATCFATLQATIAHSARFGPSATSRGFAAEDAVLEADVS